jgi:uncharacterized protein YsxB (DUF464 family)
MISITTREGPDGSVVVQGEGHAADTDDDLEAVRVCACVSHTLVVLASAFDGHWGGDRSGDVVVTIPQHGLYAAELLIAGLVLLASVPEYASYVRLVREERRLFASEESAPWEKLRVT